MDHAPHIADTLHLLYHELSPFSRSYRYALTTETFSAHCNYYCQLRENGHPVLPAISFDDGHESDWESASPVLADFGLKARFFITAGFLGKTGYMSWQQLRALLASGQRIGAHGWSHRLMTGCDRQQLATELDYARKALEDGLGIAVTELSLPGGRSNARVLAACQDAGYTRVYTTEPKIETDSGGFTVGRLNVRSDLEVEGLERLFAPHSPMLARLHRSYRLKNMAKKMVGDNLYRRIWTLANGKQIDAEDGAMAAL